MKKPVTRKRKRRLAPQKRLLDNVSNSADAEQNLRPVPVLDPEPEELIPECEPPEDVDDDYER